MLRRRPQLLSLGKGRTIPCRVRTIFSLAFQIERRGLYAGNRTNVTSIYKGFVSFPSVVENVDSGNDKRRRRRRRVSGNVSNFYNFPFSGSYVNGVGPCRRGRGRRRPSVGSLQKRTTNNGTYRNLRVFPGKVHHEKGRIR